MALPPPYSTEFGYLAGATSGVSSAYTVPSGKRAVLRDVCLICSSGTSAACYIYSLDEGINLAYRVVAVAPGDAQWSGLQVFNHGFRMGLNVVSGTWSARFSGYLLADP